MGSILDNVQMAKVDENIFSGPLNRIVGRVIGAFLEPGDMKNVHFRVTDKGVTFLGKGPLKKKRATMSKERLARLASSEEMKHLSNMKDFLDALRSSPAKELKSVTVAANTAPPKERGRFSLNPAVRGIVV